MGAENESALVRLRYMTAGLPVSSAMVTRFDALDHGATLNEAIDMLLGTSQHEFAVLDDNGGLARFFNKKKIILPFRPSRPQKPVTPGVVTRFSNIFSHIHFLRGPT